MKTQNQLKNVKESFFRIGVSPAMNRPIEGFTDKTIPQENHKKKIELEMQTNFNRNQVIGTNFC